MNNKVKIYTDGACSGNPGPGGWGAILYFYDKKQEIFGSCLSTTNNRMEVTAAIEAIKALNVPSEITIYTDSQYLKKAMTEWLTNWKKNNWRTANKAPVKNKELWQELDELTTKHRVSWEWVKGHSTNIGNQIADSLAVKGKEKAMKGV